MNPTLIFWMVFSAIALCFIFSDAKYHMLRDSSLASPRPFSYSRVQLAWWTAIIFSSIISALFIQRDIPILFNSTLYLLGVSTATTAIGRIIDVADQGRKDAARHQDRFAGENFLVDILSDENGISIHRFQAVLFNLLFGIWFIYNVIYNLAQQNVEGVIPDLQPNYLVLLSLSSATYAVLKGTENRVAPACTEDEFVSDQSAKSTAVAQG